MAYLVYFVASDESATVLNTPVYVSEMELTGISDDLLLEIIKGLYRLNNQTLRDDITTGTEALEYMRYEECMYYSEDTFVIIEDDGKIAKELETIGNALYDSMHDDSSCYAAAKAWFNIVMSHGDEIPLE